MDFLAHGLCSLNTSPYAWSQQQAHEEWTADSPLEGVTLQELEFRPLTNVYPGERRQIWEQVPIVNEKES